MALIDRARDVYFDRARERWKQKGFDADITDILEDYRAETNKKIKREKVNVLSTFLISLYDYDHDSLQLDITKLNLPTAKVKEIMKQLLSDGYYDFSDCDFQPMMFVEKYKFDEGKSKPYFCQGSLIQFYAPNDVFNSPLNINRAEVQAEFGDESVFDFVEGEYELHSATPPCTVDGFEFDLANLSFEELADDLKDEILGCRMSIFCLEDCTDEEVEEIFARLNNSTPLSPIQKCRSIMSTELARWTKEICSMDFFQHSIGLTVAQLRREADLEVLLQSMLLLDSRHEGYDEWKGISTAEVTKYCKHIRGKYNDDKKLMIMELFEYLGKAFREQHKFLKKSNIPMVVVLSKLALENDIKPEKFKVFIDSFSNSVCVDYEENTGSGNVKRVKTEGRLSAIAKAFADYFDLENANILSVEKNADFDDVPTSENENSEVDDVTASTDEDTPAMGSFMNDPTEEAVDTEDMDTEGDDAEEVADEAGENSGISAESE